MIFGVFLLAFVLVAATSRLSPIRERRLTGFRPEGIAFVTAVLLAAGLGLWLGAADVQDARAHAAREYGLKVLCLSGALYVLVALRGSRRLPPILADVLVIIAAFTAIQWLGPHSNVEGVRLPLSQRFIDVRAWSVVLTLGWVWVLSRMTAALNRTPQVTGGYVGIAAATLLLVHLLDKTQISRPPNETFAYATYAALAGGGLASVPVALKLPHFNIGWSAALTTGFVLAQASIAGLSKNLAFAILVLFVLVFGLPLLDVSFYQLRTARRGQNVAWEENRLRLHEVLLKRGLSPAKVSLLYLTVAATLCGLGVLVVLTSGWFWPLRVALLASIFCFGFFVFFSVARLLMRRGVDEEIPEYIEAFGVRISAVSMQEAMDKIEGFIATGKPHHVVTSDANAILRAQEDAEYAAILQRAALITPDGYGVIWGARLMNLPIYERVTGVDMVTGICERAVKNNYRIFILGSEPGIASTAGHKLAEQYPGLQIVGTHHGMIIKDPELQKRALQQIKDARPHVLFVAMGIPLQEKFIAQHMADLDVPVCLGVGGSFDVYSEKLKRAPKAIQRAGLEWLYRVWQEPWRWKRMGYVPRFMVLAIKTWILGDHPSARKSKPTGV